MKKLTKIIILAVTLIGLFLFILEPKIMGAFLGLFESKEQESKQVKVVDINYGNIEAVLSKTNLVNDMPEQGSILIRFYNFNKGYRQWENSYIVKKGSVKKQKADADISLYLHSKYLPSLNTGNFCYIIQKAKQNGDLGFYSELSKAKLLWRYKGMLKHRKCLGF
jgi:hypothetical protein